MASTEDLDAMEAHLARQAVESDVDVLRVVVRRWEDYLDPDGQEPSDQTLKVRQGVFLRGTRAGLHFMEISATTQQFEHLMTAMNTATNPRLHASTKPAADGPGAQADKPGSEGSLPAVDSPSHAQLLLEGLVGACRIALTTDKLPAAGGHRPQVMVTINHEDLVSRLTNADRSARSQAGRAGHGVFAGLLGARSVRQLACDADIIPVVLGGGGQILDIGRSQRLFPTFMRKGLIARDGGCAFPDCTIPTTWCEAHHINPWEHGGVPPAATTAACSAPGIITYFIKVTGESKQLTAGRGSSRPAISTR
ncbi:HNH endonuclease signature motif containing protein, partial [Arthrobacter sp. H5]|uniref:HNH endonuclease signature motif containing protein n=1 Tax=Arthrobacter sp. H5 TaxID=1267973 RepID=UPI00138AE9EA